MSIKVELCSYDPRGKCLYCDHNYRGFCEKYKAWCNFAIPNCDECIIILYPQKKRQINRCVVYKYREIEAEI